MARCLSTLLFRTSSSSGNMDRSNPKWRMLTPLLCIKFEISNELYVISECCSILYLTVSKHTVTICLVASDTSFSSFSIANLRRELPDPAAFANGENASELRGKAYFSQNSGRNNLYKYCFWRPRRTKAGPKKTSVLVDAVSPKILFSRVFGD